MVIHELDSQDPVHQITIVPRGQAGGMTISLPREDRAYLSKRELEERIAVCLGGRVAEQLVLNDISTGASSDIQKASQTARAMVTKYGMSERLGTIAYGNENDEVFIGRTMPRPGPTPRRWQARSTRRSRRSWTGPMPGVKRS